MNITKLNCYKYALLTGITLLSVLSLNAQERVSNAEISFYLKGPFSKLNFDVGQNGENNSRYGVGFGTQYAHYLNYYWSVSVGVEYQSYRSEAIWGSLNNSYSTTDIEGDSFEFRYSANSYKEKESLGLLNVPIRVQYEKELKGTLNLFGSAGFSIGFPINGKYESAVSGLETAGYYPQWDVLLSSPEFMGFGNLGTRQSHEMDLKSKNSYAFLLEAGIKHEIRAGNNLYASIFADIPLNSIDKKSASATSLIEYNTSNPSEFIYNSTFDAAPGTQGSRYADKLKAFAWGLKLRYAFGF